MREIGDAMKPVTQGLELGHEEKVKQLIESALKRHFKKGRCACVRLDIGGNFGDGIEVTAYVSGMEKIKPTQIEAVWEELLEHGYFLALEKDDE